MQNSGKCAQQIVGRPPPGDLLQRRRGLLQIRQHEFLGHRRRARSSGVDRARERLARVSSSATWRTLVTSG